MTLGFLRDGETFIDMGTLPGGTFSEAFSINESGQVAGTWGNNVTGDPALAAFLWHDGVMTDLSPERRPPLVGPHYPMPTSGREGRGRTSATATLPPRRRPAPRRGSSSPGMRSGGRVTCHRLASS